MTDQDEQPISATSRIGPMIAAEIHDGFVQDVIGSQMILQGILARETALEDSLRSQLEGVVTNLAGSIVEARRLIDQLSPLEIAGDLPGRLAQWLQDEGKSQATCDLVTEGDCAQLDPLVAGTLYRIAQEAVRNADQHGQATKIELRLERDGKNIRLVVSDNGCGFDPSQVSSDRFGLRAMRQRAGWFGGELTVDSTVGQGTTVQVVLPSAADR